MCLWYATLIVKRFGLWLSRKHHSDMFVYVAHVSVSSQMAAVINQFLHFSETFFYYYTFHMEHSFSPFGGQDIQMVVLTDRAFVFIGRQWWQKLEFLGNFLSPKNIIYLGAIATIYSECPMARLRLIDWYSCIETNGKLVVEAITRHVDQVPYLKIYPLKANVWIYTCTCSPTFINIMKKRSVGDYSGIPYVCTLLNCLLWVVYGLPVVEFQVLVVSINAAGCVIEVTYLVLYLMNAQKKIKVRAFHKNNTTHSFSLP